MPDNKTAENLTETTPQSNIDRRTVLRVGVGGVIALVAASLGISLFRRDEPIYASEPAKGTELIRMTRTPTLTPSSTATYTPTTTNTPTATPTSTPSATPTDTSTPLPTNTSPPTPTSTSTLTVTGSPEGTIGPTTPTATGATITISFADRGAPWEPKVAITIDDFNDVTVVRDALLVFLGENPDVKITAFPVGRNISYLEGHIPGIWRGLLDAGHEIGYHSLYHTNLADATPEDIRDEIVRFNELVGTAIGNPGFRVKFCRAPYGDYGETRANFRTVSEELGVIWVLWRTSPSWSDFSVDDPGAIGNGDIALFHDRWQDMERLGPYVEACRVRGMAMVTLSQMTLIGD